MTIDLISAAAGAAISMTPAITVGYVVSHVRWRRVATTDELTGIANRKALPRLQRCIRRQLRRGRAVAVVMLDLRGFKALNDAHGHDVGDEVLKTVARRLSEVHIVADVARLGGDEFVAVLTADSNDRWRGLVTAVRSHLGDPVDIDGVRVRPEATIGAAIASRGDRRLPELMRAADFAMYAARRNGYRSGIRVVNGGVAISQRPGLRVRDGLPARVTGCPPGVSHRSEVAA